MNGNEMKLVSFKVAKAIKESGYPYDYDDANIVENCEENESKWNFWSKLVGPTYIEVWMWLWREKNIKLSVAENGDVTEAYIDGSKPLITQFDADPEEAIIAAIEYLVENDLIK